MPLTQDVDRASEVTDWPMYLNDALGDCTIAGEGHLFGALSLYGLGTEALFSRRRYPGHLLPGGRLRAG